MVGSHAVKLDVSSGLHVEDVVVSRSVDEADLWWTGVVGKVVMVDTELVVISGNCTAVDVLHTDWNIGRGRQRRNVNVVTLTTHRLHLLHTTPKA